MKKTILMMLVAGLGFTACEQEVKNSTVPAKYVSVAKTYAGTYHGALAGQPMTLVLTVADSGLVTLTSDKSLANYCDLQIGGLGSVDVNDKKQTLNYANFALNQDNCGLRAPYLQVSLKGQTLQVSTMEWAHEMHHCSGHGDAESCSGPDDYPVAVHGMSGTFTK